MKHVMMRRIPIVLAVFCFLTNPSRADDTYIYAPSPPYCSPRGGSPDCISDEGLKSRRESIESWLMQDLIDAQDIGDISEFSPKVSEVTLTETHHARLWFLGTAVLKLYRDSEDKTAIAAIDLVSTRKLSVRRVRRLERRFRDYLSDPRIEFVEIERFAAETADGPEPDSCLLERVTPNADWEIECESE